MCEGEILQPARKHRGFVKPLKNRDRPIDSLPGGRGACSRGRLTRRAIVEMQLDGCDDVITNGFRWVSLAAVAHAQCSADRQLTAYLDTRARELLQDLRQAVAIAVSACPLDHEQFISAANELEYALLDIVRADT